MSAHSAHSATALRQSFVCSLSERYAGQMLLRGCRRPRHLTGESPELILEHLRCGTWTGNAGNRAGAAGLSLSPCETHFG